MTIDVHLKPQRRKTHGAATTALAYTYTKYELEVPTRRVRSEHKSHNHDRRTSGKVQRATKQFAVIVLLPTFSGLFAACTLPVLDAER